MRRTIFILAAILIVIFAVMSVLGSGGEYAAEKLFYRAMKTNSEIAANPDVAPPALLLSVEKDLKKLIDKYPETKMARDGNLALAEFYLAHKDYGKTLSAADSVLKKYKDDAVVSSRAQFLKGVSYERKGEWDKALKAFNVLHDKYTLTELGFQVPLYIAKYYDMKGEEEKAKEAYARARSFYEKTEREYEGKNFGYVASVLNIQTYLSSGDYEGAGRSIEEVLEKYPSSMAFNQFLPYVDPVFIEKLGQPERAIAIYKNVKEKLKDKRAIEMLSKKIDSIEKKK